jgi:hypothetical protein
VFLIYRINQKKAVRIVLVALICLIWIFNFRLFQQKNTPQINLKKAIAIQNLKQDVLRGQQYTFKRTEIEEKIEYYQKLDETKIQNLSLFLNLKQLNDVIEDENAAEKYFNKAQQIEPTIKKN